MYIYQQDQTTKKKRKYFSSSSFVTSVFISKTSRRLRKRVGCSRRSVRKKRKDGEEEGTISTRFTDLRRADSSRKLVSVDQVPSWRLKRTGVPTRVKRKPFLSAPRLSGSCPIMPFPTSTSTSEKRRNSMWGSHRNAVQEIRHEKWIYIYCLLRSL